MGGVETNKQVIYYKIEELALLFLHFLETLQYKKAFLEIAHIAARADGFVNRNESGSLRAYMAEMNVPETEAVTSTDRTLADILGNIEDMRVKHIFFVEILLLVYADGDFNDDEKLIVKEMKQLIGISDAAYDRLKNRVAKMDQLKVEGLRLILEPEA